MLVFGGSTNHRTLSRRCDESASRGVPVHRNRVGPRAQGYQHRAVAGTAFLRVAGLLSDLHDTQPEDLQPRRAWAQASTNGWRTGAAPAVASCQHLTSQRQPPAISSCRATPRTARGLELRSRTAKNSVEHSSVCTSLPVERAWRPWTNARLQL